MTRAQLIRIISASYDAALSPPLWREVLTALAENIGLAGAAYLVVDKHTAEIDCLSVVGPAAEIRDDYVRLYAPYDLYKDLLDSTPPRRLVRLSDSVPASVLRLNPWYNDCVRKYGISDVVGAKLFDSATHTVYLGIHEQKDREIRSSARTALLQELIDPLSKAARMQAHLHAAGLRSHAALGTLDQLSFGWFATESNGHIVEMNRAADRIVESGYGFRVRNNQLGARRSAEHAKLCTLFARATARTGSKAGSMLVTRHRGLQPYVAMVSPLSPRHSVYNRPLAMVTVTTFGEQPIIDSRLTDLFGLSPAEVRLAAALLSGKRLTDIAATHGVEVTTLRTQLSSIFRKVGVKRQVDLVTLLSQLHLIGPMM